jgi:D-aspartate ligase
VILRNFSPGGPGGRGLLSEVDTSTPAVILKLDPNIFHHGGLGVIRTLGRLGVPIHVVHEDPLAPAAASRYVHGRWQWNPGLDDLERIQVGLARLAQCIGRPAVLLPTDDAGALFLAEYGAGLRRWFLFPAPPPELPRRLADKHSLYLLCRERGMPTPLTAIPTSSAEVWSFAKTVGLPLVVKRTRPWQPPGRVQRVSTSLVRTQDDVASLVAAWPGGKGDTRPASGGEAGPGVMLQEYIPGGQEADWFFHGYCDADSVCRPGFTGIKERSYPAHAGLTSFGRSVENARLRADIEQLLRDLSYRGVVDVDLRRDARDGRFRLLDFNPRLGAQFRVFEDGGGIDVARAAYLDLTRQPIPEQQPRSDRRFVVENYDLLAALSYRRRGELDIRTWIRSLCSVDETAWFARDDLAPFGLMCLRTGWRAAQRPFGVVARQRITLSPRYRPGRARITTRPA